MRPSFPEAPWHLDLQPLRIPSGWSIGWNKLYASSRVENGDFGGSSIFYATNEGRRFNIDLAFEPEFDPEGQFHLVIRYQPWPRTARSRRRSDLPLKFDSDAEIVHRYQTTSYAAAVVELERWLGRCTIWVREGN